MGFRYDVFICHRPSDVGENLVSHLKAALRRRRIKVYEGDDDDLEKGSGAVPGQILRAIEESKVLLVVLSKKFAGEPWCLDQLAKILKDRDKNEQIVVPVFYKVDPGDVRDQTGRFGAAFDRHGKRFEEEKVQRWRVALVEIANLSGFSSSTTSPESALVDLVVEDVEKKLKSPKRSVEVAFAITNFVLEIPSAAADQLSSVHKPFFALIALITSLVSLALCIADLTYRGRSQRVRSRRWWPIAPFFGGFVDRLAFFCAAGQLIVTGIGYRFIHAHQDSPIKISVWPLVFAFGFLCSKFMETRKPATVRDGRVTTAEEGAATAHEEVEAKAEDFMKRVYQQLKSEKMYSIMSNKEK